MSVAEALRPTPSAPSPVRQTAPPTRSRAELRQQREQSLARLQAGWPELEAKLTAVNQELANTWAKYIAARDAVTAAEIELRAAKAADERAVRQAEAALQADPAPELAEFRANVLARIEHLQTTKHSGHADGLDRLQAEVRALFRVRDECEVIARSGVDGEELYAKIGELITSVEAAASGRKRAA
ncbi:MAG: hypothetical protein U0871_13595 [Gemmataceae bacterium]